MNQWEIWSYDPGYGGHPCVIVSHPRRVANKPFVEVLLCSSQRASRAPTSAEVILDRADGLDWETLCKCDLIVGVDKQELRNRRGEVSPIRRRQIVERIIDAHGWNVF